MVCHAVPVHRRIDLDRVEALRLLGSVSLGRIVFTRQALPTVRPVNHVLDDGDIVIRTHEGAALTSHARQGADKGVVVAYEADVIDPDTHLGWSVVVTGRAHLATDPGELDRVRALWEPWAAHEDMDHAVRIRPDLVTGVLLSDTAGTPGDGPAEGGGADSQGAGARRRTRTA
ncbi:pyridoxamine 5'-phosphate oxidase family protein [Streptomyces sp. MMG1121]|uniref:pyridoxamine 5'-phosphate oxidase family protein n=1 Tax=Streptomyces sp. MMG1121 TaxID=1415544 RepID=UPI00099C2A60|nr:pyridoxamine 5'-phosphate oxidase family protein [Streptomyces sp. MMG1121]